MDETYYMTGWVRITADPRYVASFAHGNEEYLIHLQGKKEVILESRKGYRGEHRFYCAVLKCAELDLPWWERTWARLRKRSRHDRLHRSYRRVRGLRLRRRNSPKRWGTAHL